MACPENERSQRGEAEFPGVRGLEEGLDDICLPALDSALVSEVGQACLAFFLSLSSAGLQELSVQPRLTQQLDALASLNVTQGVLQDVQQETAEAKHTC